jgi:hypothetical protein
MARQTGSQQRIFRGQPAPVPRPPRGGCSSIEGWSWGRWQASGASPAELRDFFARGMLMNVAAAMDLPEICAADGAWAERLLKPK